MSAGIIDIECVLACNMNYLIKEMSVIDTNTLSTQHWIFKHTSNTQNAKSRAVNKWLERNFHQLPLEQGDVKYEEVGTILNSLKFNSIYVKGEQKQHIIQGFISHINVINLEDLGCPRLEQICTDDNIPCCIFHMNLDQQHCTFHKVFSLKKWYLNNL